MQAKNKQQLIVFVKAPIPGQCKTRLTPFLSANQASEFYKQLVHICLNNIFSITQTDIVIYCAPDTQHPFFQDLSDIYQKPLYSQQGNDLGERMHHAISHSLQSYDKCILIGTDCPLINASYIHNALDSLNINDIVFGPAEDGGYVLVGANKINHDLFKNIKWSSKKVLQQSLANNQSNKYTTHLLDTLWDIDTADDYMRYKKLNRHEIEYT